MFAWTASLEIGIRHIDAQHRELFGRAAGFARAVDVGEPFDRLEELFAFLSEYALEHFADEERYMRQVGYPRLVEHMDQHRQFRRQLASLVPQWNSEGASRAMLLALLGFLKTWLTEHIAGSDQRIADHAREAQD